MSTYEDILNGKAGKVLAQQTPEEPVTQKPQPQVSNSNVSETAGASVQSEAADKTRAALESKPKIELVNTAMPKPKAEVQNPNGPAVAEKKQMSYQDMFKQLNPYVPPTPEELEKERKKQKREAMMSAISDGISSLANLYFTTKGAPNMFTPDKSMSETNRALWDKLTAERKEDAARYSQGIMNAARLDEERQKAAERAKTENKRWQMTFSMQKAANDAAAKLGREKFEYEKERDKAEADLGKQKFEEAVRQFNITSKQTAEKIRTESARLAREAKKDEVTFALGKGKGTVRIPADARNAANVAYVFSQIPDDVRATVHGDPIYNKLTGQVDGYGEPSLETMLVAIGTYVGDYPAVQDALREIAGEDRKGKKPNPME